MALSEKQIIRLNNKHKGALNNDKGHQYEDFFATFCIAQLCQNPTENKTSKIQSQVLAFVDDLLVTKDSGKLLYHQLKDVKSLSWKGDLESDFCSQVQLSAENGEDFNLILVTSNEDLFNSEIPDTISVYTSKYLFPSFSTMSEFVMGYEPLRISLTHLLPNCHTNDRLENLGTAILGIWCGSGRDITISNMIDRLKKMPFLPLSYISDIDPDIMDTLNKYGFSYSFNNGYLNWSYKNFDGLVEIRTLDKESLKNSVSDIDVINLLS